MHLKQKEKRKFIKALLRQRSILSELDKMPSLNKFPLSLFFQLGPVLGHILKSPVLAKILLSQFNQTLPLLIFDQIPELPTPMVSDHPSLPSARCLWSQFSQNPSPLISPLSNSPSIDHPPTPCSLAVRPHLFILHLELSPILPLLFLLLCLLSGSGFSSTVIH